LDEQGRGLAPRIEQTRRVLATGVHEVALDQITNELRLLVRVERLQLHELGIAPRVEMTVRIQHICDAAAHAGGEVPAGFAQHDDTAPRHVLAAVVADPFDNRERTAVSDRESLSGNAPNVDLA